LVQKVEAGEISKEFFISEKERIQNDIFILKKTVNNVKSTLNKIISVIDFKSIEVSHQIVNLFQFVIEHEQNLGYYKKYIFNYDICNRFSILS
jgi:hypothetical protein